MKRQYIALLIMLAVLTILSLWAASTTNTHDIERKLTNTSNERHGGSEGLVEGGNLLLYLSVTGILFVIAAGAYFLVIRR